jgi:hypothetical protein
MAMLRKEPSLKLFEAIQRPISTLGAEGNFLGNWDRLALDHFSKNSLEIEL